MKIFKLKFHLAIMLCIFAVTGCRNLKEQPVMELSQITKTSQPFTGNIPPEFLIIDQNSRIMQEDELTKEMVFTLKTLTNYQISGEMNGVPATFVLNEFKKRMTTANFATLSPIWAKGSNNSKITLKLSNASVLLSAVAIALCSNNQLRLRENGQLVILPEIDEFSPAGLLQPQPGGNLVLKEKKKQIRTRVLKFKAFIQGIIVGPPRSPIGFIGNQKYFLPKLKELLHLRYEPLIAIEKDPRIELQIILQAGHDYHSVFSFDSLGNVVRHIALHDYKNYFGNINPVEKSYDFTIESTISRDGAVSYQLKHIKPSK